MYSRPAIDTRLIDGRVYVVAVLEDAQHEAGIRPGLEIVSLDGIPVHEYADTRVAPYCSASTPQGAEVLNYSYYLLCGAPEDDVKLELRDETGALSTATLPRNFHRILSAEPFAFRILDGGIAYVAINSFGSRAQVAAFDSVFSELEETDALIIDLRRNAGGNSDVGYDILASLTREAFPTHRARAPVYEALVRAQGRPQRWDDVSPATWPPAARCYAKPTAVLIGPETGSAAEDFCVTFAAMQRGPLIGMPTAGTTGQPLRFPLPGGGSGRVCTCDCVGPDGTEYVGKGVQPDIAVHTTAANLRAGLDAELEAAMKKLRGASEN
jgi:C-terminal processing protease CtpA/Prc